MNYIIGMDIGTTSTKAVLYGEDGQVYTHANEGYPLYRDATGMAEEDQEEILAAVTKTLKKITSKIDFKKTT
jgi:Sugar (pentulose and hexulose) kinases